MSCGFNASFVPTLSETICRAAHHALTRGMEAIDSEIFPDMPLCS